MSRGLPVCVVCGEEVIFAERVAVITRGRSGEAICMHGRCATHFAAGVLQALHTEESRRTGGERRSIRRATGADRAGLTPLELRVLHCMARGYTNRQIAADLGIALKTARNMVSNVLLKLDAVNRAEAVAIATREGLLE